MTKRKKKHTDLPGQDTQKAVSTVVMSIHRSLQSAAASFSRNSFLVPQDVQQRLMHEVLRQVDANARVAVLTSWFINVYLSWLPDDYICTSLGPIDQNFCSAAAYLCSNTGNPLTGRGQPTLKRCFDDVFAPTFPADFDWPRHAKAGNVFNALAREMAVNYHVYMDVGFHAHVVKYLQIEAGVKKYQAKAAWERANRVRPERPGPLTLDEHQWVDQHPATTPVEIMAEELVALSRRHPVLAHRFLLGAVERRQRLARVSVEPEGDDAFTRTGKLFSLFPLRTIKTHFATLDVKVVKQWLKDNPDVHANVENLQIQDSDLLGCFFPRRNGGWTPAAEIKTDGVRVALTYERRVPKRTVGGATVRDAKKSGRKRIRLETPTSATSSSSADGDVTSHPAAQRVDIRHARKGIYALNDVAPDATLVFNNRDVWEAFDPGLTTLYQGHHGTHMSRRQWRFETGAERATRKANQRDIVNFLPVLQHLAHGSLKSASTAVLCQRLRDVWVYHWHTLWRHYGARWWGQQRFRQHIKEQRTLDKVANDVLGPSHQRIAVFGDGVFPASMKGVPPAPVTKVRNSLARKGRVIMVDEFKTSKTCHQCLSEMRQHRGLHTTKHCKSEVHTWSWNRDVNAAANIAFLFQCYMAGVPRPKAFCRATAAASTSTAGTAPETNTTATTTMITSEEHSSVGVRSGMDSSVSLYL